MVNRSSLFHGFVLATLPHIQASRTAQRGAVCRSVASSRAASGVALSTGISSHVDLRILNQHFRFLTPPEGL
jgi:hypothetical protein